MSEIALLLPPENRAASLSDSSARSVFPVRPYACASCHVADPELRVHEDRPPRVLDRGGIVAGLKRDL